VLSAGESGNPGMAKLKIIFKLIQILKELIDDTHMNWKIIFMKSGD